MRYTCFKTIVSKVFDGVLDDDEEIANVLNFIREKELSCSMQVKSGPVHETVRILAVDDSKITWRLIESGSSLKKTSDITDITAISLNANEELMVTLKPAPTRWSTLDASDV
jgi:hypothetical protein